MKKTIEKILKGIIDATSITDMCDKSVCHWLQPVVDTIVFPEYYLFSSTHVKENIISLLIVLGGFTNIWSNCRRNDEAHLQKE
ncbi:hypothetical protein BF28_4481 [Bacillus cereus E33L]|uniref:Group-specific protein n=1 Tax=Bacillus cereus (strain ZK / E33L) TaxID=288681 RepID=Q63EP1_BACCZ|nr:group-specific protein [Bacillus cereus E33L]AJI29309.1 hypothetical protein BF28_4481 [Bacillus cereus E33L]